MRREGVSDWFWDYYPPSPRMPTYLVAFMVHSLQDVVWLSGAGTHFCNPYLLELFPNGHAATLYLC